MIIFINGTNIVVGALRVNVFTPYYFRALRTTYHARLARNEWRELKAIQIPNSLIMILSLVCGGVV